MNIVVLILLLSFGDKPSLAAVPLRIALLVPTSEREGKLSNPPARAARAMQGENLRKFTETRARSPRARHALILPQPKIQYHGMYYLYIPYV